MFTWSSSLIDIPEIILIISSLSAKVSTNDVAPVALKPSQEDLMSLLFVSLSSLTMDG